ncbi:MAG: dehydrogenase [Verrucomicrobiales bacterium]|nr:dehydrogenase [Verrucomicrobiales bacterium]
MRFTITLFAILCFGSAFAQEEKIQHIVPVSDIEVPDGLEVTLWASSPLLYNPTNIDTDAHGRIWVAEGVNYRREVHRPEGDRIVVVEDTDGDGTADSSHTFVQDPELISPLGISVFDNKIVVAQPPHILVYTDVDRDTKFDPAVDKREEFLSGFNARNHDHSLHTVFAGPDGKWYFSQGNCGAKITDRNGRVFQSGGPYYEKGAGNPEWFNDPNQYAGKPSADGNVYNAGFAARISPDGSGLEIVGHGFRNPYEQCVSSMGDIFQNDNDDRVSCRNTWLMEGGNLGFFSSDGTRLWQLDRRPGQSTARAHWRQDDPGIIPAGDVYGGGSPTGVCFYENGALPESYSGTFLSCEARARVIYAYQPRLSETGAEVELGKRTEFLISKENLNFRPSDIIVGADGALYVADWYDTKVGGHKAEDPTHSGAIYRIAPKGFRSRIQDSGDGIALLKSPAASVRLAGFEKLKAAGADALPSVKQLLNDDNRWIRARAVWLLPHLGKEGAKLCRERLTDSEAEERLLAFRALRAAGADVIDPGKNLVTDDSAAVRREVAVSLRDADNQAKLPLVLELWKSADGKDRHYIEACGLAAQDIEGQVWHSLREQHGGDDPVSWSDTFARQTWRLMPEAAVSDLEKRANADSLTAEQRKLAVETLAFIGTREAVDALTVVAAGEGELADFATWWFLSRGLTKWGDFGVREMLKERGIYDPETVQITAATIPDFDGKTTLPSPKELAEQEGDPVAGKAQANRCIMCHKIDGIGVDYGPDLIDWVANQGKEAFYEAVIFPSSGIAHGFTGTVLTLKNGDVVEGLTYSELDPVTIVSLGGHEQRVPKDRIKSKRRMWQKSLMLSADQLGFTAQQLVDLAAYLETWRSE